MTAQAQQDRIAAWAATLAGAEPATVLRWASETFGNRVAFASSLGVEDQVITHLIAENSLDIPVFTLDTGRLFPETHNLIDETRRRYGLPVAVYCPDAADVELLVKEHGVNLFRLSVELRRQCCRVRKVKPLQRALADLDAWVCGLRREQSVTRTALHAVAWDAANGLVKISPLADWQEDEVWRYAREHNVPCNPLHDQGFPSIGCACCTRAVASGEDARAGRWWWEQPEKKECGLHWHDGKLVRAAQPAVAPGCRACPEACAAVPEE